MNVFVFPGQGAQFKGMGDGLFDKYPQDTAMADEILGYSIADLCLRDPDRQLHNTLYTQPALYVVNALHYKDKIAETGTIPDYLAGHSLGEHNALQASGAISFADGLKMVKRRGELMSQAPKGAMAAILGSTEDNIRQILDRNGLSTIDIANYNSPDQTVVSGLDADIRNAEGYFSKADIKFIPLNTSGAFHSRYMKPSGIEFKKYLKTFTFAELTIPVISNVHAKPYEQGDIIENLSAQISCSVKWSESIRYLLEKGARAFDEIGASVVLTTLIDKIRDQAALESVDAAPDTVNTVQEASLEYGAVVDNKAKKDSNVFDADDIQRMVADWNNTYPVGSKVSAKNHAELLETRTEATVLFGRRAAVYMKGFNGYFDLTEITPQDRAN